MIELGDHHLAAGAVLLVAGKVDERDEMLHHSAAFVAHGADEDRCPEFAAVLAPIVDLGVGSAVPRELRLDARHPAPADPLGQQRLELFAENFLAVVTSQSEEGVIGKDKRVAGRTGIGEDHRHPRLFRRGDKWPEFAPKDIDCRFGVLLLSRLDGNLRHFCPIKSFTTRLIVQIHA